MLSFLEVPEDRAVDVVAIIGGAAPDDDAAVPAGAAALPQPTPDQEEFHP
ncbi:MAG: hypothetical protein HC774_07210 [Sphingomonadales bacterium]|nr:hypothetical protein [Sphingomonadales bacterium]